MISVQCLSISYSLTCYLEPLENHVGTVDPHSLDQSFCFFCTLLCSSDLYSLQRQQGQDHRTPSKRRLKTVTNAWIF